MAGVKQEVKENDSQPESQEFQQKEYLIKSVFDMIKDGDKAGEIVEYIRQNFPNFDDEIVDNIHGRHALSAAIAHRHPSLIIALLETFEDVDWEVPDNDGKYPLHLAAERQGIVSFYVY